MKKVSRAELFYEEITQQGDLAFGFLAGLAEQSAQTDENEWRDFKEAGPLTGYVPSAKPEVAKQRSDKIKEIWSEYISAFANSGGGVLIWGISAPKRFASGISLAANARELAERLTELANNAVDPPVQGIRIESFQESEESAAGFVVCFIPESRFAPHAAKWARREYYLRSQDGNIPCSNAILRRLFYPRSYPDLRPAILIKRPLQKSSVISEVYISAFNHGNLTAAQPYFRVSYSEGIEILPARCNDISISSSLNPCGLTPGQDIHPGIELQLFILKLKQTPVPGSTFDIAIDVFCRDCESTRWVFKLTNRDLTQHNHSVQPREAAD